MAYTVHPEFAMEAVMWRLGAGNAILPSWMNPDGSVYSGQALAYTSTSLQLIGDALAWKQRFSLSNLPYIVSS